MNSTSGFHGRLRMAAIGIALLNLPSVLILFRDASLNLREWLFYFDPWFVVCVIVPLYIILLPALPFLICKRKEGDPVPGHKIWLVATAIILFGFEALWWVNISIATFCRGSGWTFYWPWEPRIAKVESLLRMDWSDYWWYSIRGQPFPSNIWLRESPGLVILFVLIMILPIVTWLIVRRAGTNMAWWRTVPYFMIVSVAILLPFKMLALQLFALRYIVYFPEFMLNV